MSKILKNNSGSTVSVADTGVSILNAGQYTIPPQDYLLWAGSGNVITYIGAGTLVVNDGSADLSISAGVDLIKGIFPTSIKIRGHSGQYDADVTQPDTYRRLMVDGVVQASGASNILNIGFGASITTPGWPAVKPLGYFIVPAGKKFKLLGAIFKTSSATTYMHIYRRKTMWKFSATALATPAAATLTAKTISGSGLTVLSIYRYKVVAVGPVGGTAGGTESSVTLTGTQNAVSLSWAAIAGAAYYQIFRTIAGGASNSQVLLGESEGLTFTDVVPDSELDTGVTCPVSNTSQGSSDGDAYPTNYAASTVVIDTIGAITTVTPLDIIYKNIYGERKYISTTPGAAAGSQVEIIFSGKTNPVSDTRIKRGANSKNHIDVSMNDVMGVGNTPATGSFIIYGYEFVFQSAASSPNKWDTYYLNTPIIFNAGDEVVYGVSANTAVTTVARNDVILVGSLE